MMDAQILFREAIKNKNIERVMLFLKYPEFKPDFFTLSLAAKVGCVKIFKLLFKEKLFNLTESINAVFTEIGTYGHTDLAKIILNSEIKNLGDNNLGIQYAAQNGHFELVKLLLNDKRINPTKKNNWAILAANDNGYNDIVTLLFNDKRIKQSLKESNSYLYNKLMPSEIKLKLETF
jgi:hypothetical protein